MCKVCEDKTGYSAMTSCYKGGEKPGTMIVWDNFEKRFVPTNKLKIRDSKEYWKRATSFSLRDQETVLKEGD